MEKIYVRQYFYLFIKKLWNPWKPIHNNVPKWVIRLAWKKCYGKDNAIIYGKHFEYKVHWTKKEIGFKTFSNGVDLVICKQYKFVSPSFERRYKL